MKIFKYPLVDGLSNGTTVIGMPIGAQVLCLKVQNGTPCLWAYCDPEVEQEMRSFLTLGTGMDNPYAEDFDHVYVGTYMDGPFVWHVFELHPKPH